LHAATASVAAPIATATITVRDDARARAVRYVVYAVMN